MGGLLWGQKDKICLGLDRGDLWDERPAIGKGWWKQMNWKTGGDWDAPYRGADPTTNCLREDLGSPWRRDRASRSVAQSGNGRRARAI